MTRAGLQVLSALGVSRLLRMLYAKRLAVLMYHGFRVRGRSPEFDVFAGNHVFVDDFEQQMKYLRKYYSPVSTRDILECHEKGRKLPSRAVLVTIDDGYESSYTLAFSVLKKYGVPAEIFLSTSFLDRENPLWTSRLAYALVKTGKKGLKVLLEERERFFDVFSLAGKTLCLTDFKNFLKRIPQEDRDALLDGLEKELGVRLSFDEAMPDIDRPLTWDQVREMKQSGLVGFGAHTHRHFILTRCSVETRRWELETSRQRIEQELGEPCRTFAYPNGDIADFNAETRAGLQQAGFMCAFTTLSKMNRNEDDLFELGRLAVSDRMNLVDFEMLLAQIYPLLRRIKRVLHIRK